MEIKNIYKEIAGIRCDVELHNQLEKKKKIADKIEVMPKEIDGIQKSFLINVYELQSFVFDLFQYESEQSHRLNYEIF